MSGQMFITWQTNSTITDAGWEAYYFADWVGVEEIPNKLKIKVFPVPVREEINIEIRNNKAGTIQIDLISVNGKVLISEGHSIAEDQEISFRTDNIPNGIYILRIRTGQEERYRKIVIQK